MLTYVEAFWNADDPRDWLPEGAALYLITREKQKKQEEKLSEAASATCALLAELQSSGGYTGFFFDFFLKKFACRYQVLGRVNRFFVVWNRCFVFLLGSPTGFFSLQPPSRHTPNESMSIELTKPFFFLCSRLHATRRTKACHSAN
jgi:hypothetical protein